MFDNFYPPLKISSEHPHNPDSSPKCLSLFFSQRHLKRSHLFKFSFLFILVFSETNTQYGLTYKQKPCLCLRWQQGKRVDPCAITRQTQGLYAIGKGHLCFQRDV